MNTLKVQFPYHLLEKQCQERFKISVINPNLDNGIESYLTFYNQVVKQVENAEHYNKCFNIINPIFEKFLDNFFPRSSIKKVNFESKRKLSLCFFTQNLSSSLAHAQVINEFLSELPSGEIDIFISGHIADKDVGLSNLYKKLLDKKIINFIELKSYSSYDLISFVKENEARFDFFIIFGPPTLIPFFSIFFQEKLIFFSLKFEYDCFTNLLNGITYNSNTLNTLKLNKTTWHQIPPYVINLNYPMHEKKINKQNIKFITINRPEKINNLFYLESIKEILIKIPQSTFYWTGSNNDKEIINFFKNTNLLNRIRPIGWIKPEEIINEYDIFLDTPFLSGSVACNYFLSGMPVVTFKNSNSYIATYSDNLKSKFDLDFACNTHSEYVDYAIKLALDIKFNLHVKNIQINAKEIFPTSKDFLNNFLKVLNKIKITLK